MKTPAPLVVTVAALLLGFFFVMRKENAPQVKDDKPEEIIYEMFDAAKAGRIRKYLNCFAPELREDLDKRRREQGSAAFKRYLRERSVPVNGIAISDKQLGDTAGSVKVEWVFQDRNEVQTVRLKKVGRAWKVAALSEARREEQIVPYGTPAYPVDTEEKGSDQPEDYEYEYTAGDEGAADADAGAVPAPE